MAATTFQASAGEVTAVVGNGVDFGENYAEIYDSTRDGTIRINYQDDEGDGRPVPGAVFSYYRVADLVVENSGGSVGSRYHGIIPGINIDGSTKGADISQAVMEAYKDKEVPRGITGPNGIATTKLSPGAYLAVETRPGMGHDVTSPFMFSVPEANISEGHVNGWNYAVKAEPKTVPVGIGTTLTDAETELHESGVNKKGAFVDAVAFEGLNTSTEYIMRGSMIDAKTGKPLGITKSVPFTPGKPNGVIKIPFSLDTSEMAGKEIVVFEDLFIHKVSHDETDVNEGRTPDEDGTDHTDDLPNNPTNKVSDGTKIDDGLIRISTHNDISDKGQTVSIVRIRTSLNSESGKYVESGKTTLTDTVLVEGLIPGETYELDAELMDKEAKASTGITGSRTFKAAASKMYVNVEFKADISGFAGKHLVAFEKLFRIRKRTGTPDKPDKTEKKLITVHEDLKDEDQTVTVVRIRTTLTEKSTKLHETEAGKSRLVDTVAYEGLTKGTEYTLKASLYNKQTGKLVPLSNGKTMSTCKFKADGSSGYAEVPFSVDTKDLGGAELVALEELYTKKGDAAPKKDDFSDSKVPGDKKPELKSKNGLTKIAEHKDKDDKSQTVRVIRIGTTLTEKKTGKKTVDAEKTTLTDAVKMSGLAKGGKYVLKGELMRKSDGKSTGITKTKKFTADGSEQTVNLDFKVNAADYANDALVAFEKLYREGPDASKEILEDNPDKDGGSDKGDKLVASHEKIDDADQTVHVNKKKEGKSTPTPAPKSGSTTPGNPTIQNAKTGDVSNVLMWGLICAAAALVGTFAMLFMKVVSSDL